MAEIESLHLIGGTACLDLVNSVNSHASSNPKDRLESYADLLVLSRRIGVITGDDEVALAARALDDPAAAQGVLRSIRDLRELLYRMFGAVAIGEQAAEPDLAAFNSFLTLALSKARITRGDAGYEIDFDAGARLDGVLAHFVWSAAELLRGADLARVKTCGNTRCGWLFVDRSKNKSRRWCEMSDCGNTAKVRRYNERKRGGTGTAPIT